jgi:hypothetical protein
MDVDHRPNETSPVPPSTFTTSRSLYAGEFFGAAYPGSSRLPWPSLSLTSSALPCSPSGANLSTLQDSRNVAGCGFALLSQEVTTLQHLRSPRSTGCLLRGPLVVTTTGLPPVSRRQLFQDTPATCYAALPPTQENFLLSLDKVVLFAQLLKSADMWLQLLTSKRLDCHIVVRIANHKVVGCPNAICFFRRELITLWQEIPFKPREANVSILCW